MEWYGYTGRILNINLSNEKITVNKQNIKELSKYIGGFGMNCKLFADTFDSGTDPLSEKNIIIIGAGPLAGTSTPGTTRTFVISRFPATGAIANSCGSMSFAYHLKNAGYDHIVISGKSQKPMYLLIMDNNIEFCEAKNLWGKDIVDSTNLLKRKYRSCGVIAIGQAGENLVKSSLTLIDKTSTLGRGGLGAIMGFKNLKAIVSKGAKGVSIAYPKEYMDLYNSLMNRIRSYPHRDSWIELGMLRSLPVGMLLKARGQPKKARQCTDRFYLKRMKKRRIACPSCPMADKDILEIKEGEYDGLINYTSSIINPLMMFTVDGIKSYDQAIKAFDLISRYGLDSLTITSLFDFINSMHKKHIITDKQIGFDWVNNFNSLIKLIKIIVYREGFGNLLADGWKKLAEINETLANEMLTVKGLDVIFEPRFLRLGSMEFEQVVNPKGAHVASGGSPTYVGASSSFDKMKGHFNRMGIKESAFDRIFSPPIKEMGINVGRLTRYSEDWYTILSSQSICARAQINRFWSLELVTKFYNTVTGFELTKEDLRIAAERSWNLLKILNMKEGFSRKDDKFPSGWFKPLKFGENQLEFQDFYGNVKITQEIAVQLLDDYYDERGWEIQTGCPSRKKITELNLQNYI